MVDKGFATRNSELDGRSELVVTGGWSPQAAHYLASNPVDRVVLNYALGFRERNLEFLRGLPIRGLTILSRTLQDLSPVYSLADTLTTLEVFAHERTVIDLDRLPRLTKLSADWPSVVGSIRFAPTIDDLYLGQYREHDLTPLAHLTRLKRLRTKDYSDVLSLDGLEDLPLIAELLVIGARSLHDISALSRAQLPDLISLNLDSCPRISDLDPVEACRALTYLNAGNCGNLPTAAPLAGLVTLEALYLYESTNILDGDLLPIAGLPRLRDFRIMSRRHYRPSAQAINDALPQP